MKRFAGIFIMTHFLILISGCTGTGSVTHGGAFQGMVSSFSRDSFHACVKDYMSTHHAGDIHSNIYCGTDEGNPVIPIRKALEHCGQELSPSEKHQFVKDSFDAYASSCRWIDSLPAPPPKVFEK